LIDSCYTNIDQGNLIGATFIDFSKAFDLVDHKLLLTKLSIYKCNSRTQDFFKSYLDCRKQTVNIGGKSSSYEDIKIGVPQGSILGPLFFILFINDLQLGVNSSDLHMYADDSTAIATGKSLDKVEQKLNNSTQLLMSQPGVLKIECM
jgi:hypothetical protein